MKIISFPFRGLTKKPGSELGFSCFLKNILLSNEKYFSDVEFLDWSQYIDGNVSKLLKFDKENILIFGGNHSTTTKVMSGIIECIPHNIIIFDAHNDYEDLFKEDFKNWNVINFFEKFGFSGLLLGYRDFEGNINRSPFFKYIDDIEFQNMDYVLNELKSYCIQYKTIYISIDLDVINFIEFPGTGFKCAGGISIRELLLCLNTIFQYSEHTIVDIVEFNPLIENEHSVLILKRLFYHLKTAMCEQEKNSKIGDL